MSNFFSTLMALIMAYFSIFLPNTKGYELKDADNVRLTAGIVSDVHIDRRLPLGRTVLSQAYTEMNKFNPDAEIVLGDLTNYGDQASLERFFQITSKTVTADNTIIITGNHDIGHAKESVDALTNEEARQAFIKLNNQYLDNQIENTWFSNDINGYTFISLGDESYDNWDHPEYSDEQLAFLDSELARGTADGKPVFVLCHVPLSHIHGEENYYADGGTEDPWDSEVKAILEKYDNVFFLTGHFHKALSNLDAVPTYTTVNGVHYLNLPSYLMPNWPVGYPIHGCTFIMEVYDDNVVFRCRNVYIQRWLTNYEYTEALV